MLVVFAITASGCAADDIVSTHDPHAAAAPRMTEAAVVAGTFQAPAPVLRELQTEYHPTGVTLPANTKVRITVTGQITVGQNPGWATYCRVVVPWWGGVDPECPSARLTGRVVGPLGASPGYDWSELGIRLRVRASNIFQDVRLSPWFYDGLQATAEFVNADEGELEIGRGLALCYAIWPHVDGEFEGGSADCYTFTGTQTVRVEIFPSSSARLTLSCPATVIRAESIACTVGSDAAGAAVRVTDWKFTGGGFTVSDETNPHALTWAGRMVQSGTVTVTGTVNGQTPQTARAIFVSVQSGA